MADAGGRRGSGSGGEGGRVGGRASRGQGLKAGLRRPWLLDIARTSRLDQAFVGRRGVPALSFAVAGHGPLEHVLVSTPDAAELARRLRSGD